MIDAHARTAAIEAKGPKTEGSSAEPTWSSRGIESALIQRVEA